MFLATTLGVATLLVSNRPFGTTDLAALELAARNFGFQVLLAPHRPGPDPSLARIADSRSPGDVEAAATDSQYDYTPPTDERPYFFNMLRANQVLPSILGEPRAANVVMVGLLSRFLPFEEQIWEKVLEENIKPRYMDINRRAFQTGREFHEPVLE